MATRDLHFLSTPTDYLTALDKLADAYSGEPGAHVVLVEVYDYGPGPEFRPEPTADGIRGWWLVGPAVDAYRWLREQAISAYSLNAELGDDPNA